MNSHEKFMEYRGALNASETQLKEIRELEAKKDAETVNGKLSRECVKMLNKLDDMYMHRMNVVVPAVAEAKRNLMLVTILEHDVEMRLTGEIK